MHFLLLHRPTSSVSTDDDVGNDYCNNNNDNKLVLRPFLQDTQVRQYRWDNSGELGTDQSAILDVDAAHRKYCSPSHSVPCRSCSQVLCQQTVLQERHTEVDQVNNDRRYFMPGALFLQSSQLTWALYLHISRNFATNSHESIGILSCTVSVLAMIGILLHEFSGWPSSDYECSCVKMCALYVLLYVYQT